jgi:hypothetical protein
MVLVFLACGESSRRLTPAFDGIGSLAGRLATMPWQRVAGLRRFGYSSRQTVRYCPALVLFRMSTTAQTLVPWSTGSLGALAPGAL